MKAIRAVRVKGRRPPRRAEATATTNKIEVYDLGNHYEAMQLAEVLVEMHRRGSSSESLAKALVVLAAVEANLVDSNVFGLWAGEMHRRALGAKETKGCAICATPELPPTKTE